MVSAAAIVCFFTQTPNPNTRYSLDPPGTFPNQERSLYKIQRIFCTVGLFFSHLIPLFGSSIMEGGAALSTEKQNESASSYTYWVRETTQDAAPLPIPKKLTSEDLNNQPQTHLGSAWNRVCTHIFFLFLI